MYKILSSIPVPETDTLPIVADPCGKKFGFSSSYPHSFLLTSLTLVWVLCFQSHPPVWLEWNLTHLSVYPLTIWIPPESATENYFIPLSFGLLMRLLILLCGPIHTHPWSLAHNDAQVGTSIPQAEFCQGWLSSYLAAAGRYSSPVPTSSFWVP